MKLLGIWIGVSALALSACGSGGGNADQLSANSTATQAEIGNTAPPKDRAVNVSKKLLLEKEDGDISFTLTLNGRTYSAGESVDFQQFPMGMSESSYQSEEVKYVKDLSSGTATADAMRKQHTRDVTKVRMYHQPYSVVFGVWQTDEWVDGKQVEWAKKGETTHFEIYTMLGQKTTERQMQTMVGKAVYQGVAFNQKQQGKLAYQVDFDKREGSGSITGLHNYGDITLHKAAIGKQVFQEVHNSYGDRSPFAEGIGIQGKASGNNLRDATYGLAFFGPQAEEIAGYVENGQDSPIRDRIIGLGGKR
ncbi:factor H binding protein domain-containing protein [Neisseria dumasiana]|uniref:factor H binding protein domain-containing protein n=1 Tax=Neisseria dumasiana TaxID=1931275 RepID=UPI000A1923C3|nr:factor H binding protein domain-containing protein [Neisseria dumasiana]